MISILASGGNSLIIGATLAVIVFLTGGISGASVNPAVSAGLWYNGTLSTNVFLLYCVVEVVGALAATAFYSFIV
jgi:aquaporin Z